MPYEIDGLLARLKVGGEDNIVVNVSEETNRTVLISYNPITKQYVAFIRNRTGQRTTIVEGEWPVAVAAKAKS